MSDVEFIQIDWAGRDVRIEYQWLAPERTAAPLLIFLHEGLGSLSMWKDFPATLCQALGCRGLVYSRPGYGRSTPRAPDEVWGVDFMHRQALEVLPALLDSLNLNATQPPPWLIGHSDGASIALLYAAHYPARCAGVVALAPHIVGEDLSFASIEKVRGAYLSTDLRQRLSKYHDDPDSAFFGWNRIWLHPEFKKWSITDEIASIACPVLALQGLDDEYGTMEQLHGIQRRVPQTEVLGLPRCGHAPQREQPQQVITAVAEFFQQHRN